MSKLKNIYTLLTVICLVLTGFVAPVYAQQDSTQTSGLNSKRKNPTDSTQMTNQDAIYNRPFIGVGGSKTAIGGYLEGNTNYFAEDGVTEGFTMEMRRFNIFLYSKMSQRVQFLAELEFEHGTEEIALETALMDFEINPAFKFRTGIILPQIGMFNSNHDSPKWDIIDRPLVSTQIIPSTLSEIGFGFYGKLYAGKNILSYDVYVVNGLQDNIILNAEGRTFIPAGKSPEMFAEDNNGTPMYNARVSATNRQVGELGISYYGGVYNKFSLEGEIVDQKRMLTLLAIDFSTKLSKLTIQGEGVLAMVDVPANIVGTYGTKQQGYFVDFVYPIIQKPMFGYEKSKINAAVRIESLDYNNGTFAITGTDIGDEVRAVSAGINFRPTSSTAIRVNYRYHWITDLLGNPPARLGGIQFGFATYF